MNWLIGIVGLCIGLVFSEERWLLGGASGFFIGWLLSSISRLQSRMNVFEAELMQARDAFRKMAAERDQLNEKLKTASQASPSRTEVTPESVKPAAPVTAIPVTPDAQSPIIPVQEKPLPVMAEKANVPNRAVFSASEPAPVVPVMGKQPPPITPVSQVPATPRIPPPNVTANMREATWDERLTDKIKRWFTEGNVPVKVGIVV
ncbi:MAG: hypothetical protein ABIP02_01335, partial [Arenimonas sp.]